MLDVSPQTSKTPGRQRGRFITGTEIETLLSGALYHLAIHPSVLNRVLAEVRSTLLLLRRSIGRSLTRLSRRGGYLGDAWVGDDQKATYAAVPRRAEELLGGKVSLSYSPACLFQCGTRLCTDLEKVLQED